MILNPLILSLKISLISTTIVLIIGVALARFFTTHSFKGKSFLEVLIILPMVLPPSVIGYGLLIIMGKRSIIGKILYNLFGVSIIFTWEAACIAAIIVSLPLMYQSCKSAFINIDEVYEKAAKTLGADKKTVFWKIAIPLAWPGIASGVALSFARALGEFGATLMVAGNIPGKTQTIPLALYFSVESGDMRTANILMGIVVVFSFVLIYGLNLWLKRKHYN